jgi:acetyl esterase
MKIVVIGGTGLIGSKTVAIVRRSGHEVIAASPDTGVNTITGEGLKQAMTGTQVVIDLANSPSFDTKAVLNFFETSGRNCLAAEAEAGVRHHVCLSIVGTDRSPDNGYFRAKVAQEKLIVASGIPYTIIRSTQFLEFLGGIAASSWDGTAVRLSPGLFQPIAADDVAAFVADVALATPVNGIVEIAGPERGPMNEIVARYLKASGDKRKVVVDREARYFGGRVEERSLVPLGEARLGRVGLDEWLRRSHEQASTAKPVLEPTAQKMVDEIAAAGGPPLFKMTPDEARGVLTRVQAGRSDMAPASIEDTTFPVGPTGTTRIRIVRPEGAKGPLPAVMWFHGGGWILGDRETHARLVREIANATRAAVVFVDYDRSPEAHYPVAIEQAYAATKYIAENGARHGIDGSRLVVAGDSVGGNMVAAVTLLAKERGGPKIDFQLMYYPVTDASFSQGSYETFKDGPWLTAQAMRWFWDAYLPDRERRKEITATPLNASVDQLRGLPDAMIIVDENDVLRDEGEAYARKLLAAGVRVTSTRFNAAFHDFVLLNPLAGTQATRAAIKEGADALRSALHS